MRRSQHTYARKSPRCSLRLEPLESRIAPAVDVVTFHNDVASTGANLDETALTPANVRVGSFGKISTTSLDGQVYAQPLLLNGIQISSGPYQGVHNVVFVATEHDSLYAISDDPDLRGTILWQRSFLDLSDPANNTLSATLITTVPATDLGSTDLSPEVGITSTPVIDPASGTLYLVARTKETIGGADYDVQRLHAIDVGSGSDRVAPFVIGTTTNGNDNTTPIFSDGDDFGSVTDPYNGTGRQVVQFNALRENQRAALNLVNGTVYVEWASHGDNGPYRGWVAAWDVANLTTSGFQLSGVLDVAPHDGEAGIWQGGGRLVFEPDGSAFYFETGNAPNGTPVLDASGFPVNGTYNDAVVKVVADPGTSSSNQNINGWGLKVADFFIPHDAAALDATDQDFGSGAPLLLPDSAGVAGHPHLMVVGGKEGILYVLDRDNLGGFDATTDNVVSDNGRISGLLSTPAWYNGHVYVLSGYSGGAKSFVVAPDGSLTATSQTAQDDFGYLPGSPIISADGSVNGIVWLMDRNTNEVHAYDANSLATELWNSGQKAGNADAVGAVVKFATPIVANGELFIGTSNALVIYGLTPPAGAVPDQPTGLSAVALSASSVRLTWQDGTQAPNTATGYVIEQSTDGVHFTTTTTAPAGATSISVGGLTPNVTYTFRIRGFNGVGNSTESDVAIVTMPDGTTSVDFSNGFGGGGLTLNGSAAIVNARLELTDSGEHEAGSAFASTAVNVASFSTRFSFQASAGDDAADGMAFVIQGVAPTALGQQGGGLGYEDVASSVAVKFDLYDNDGEGVDSTGLYVGGAAPTSAGSVNLAAAGINLHSGDPFSVSMDYDGTTLNVTLADQTTGASLTRSYVVNVPTAVGGSMAYVGFTAGTGGQTATFDVLDWVFTPPAALAPSAPSALGATPASATSVSLAWKNGSADLTGFRLDRATDPDFTQNLLTQTISRAGITSFTDVANGLTPGGTYYYRLRSFNATGDSANSNVASVTIPLAPPKSTDATVTLVTTSEIDLSWTDNAGRLADGYRILRSVDHSGFTVYASLPTENATPPSDYDWADVGVSPGHFYDYHVIAYNVSGNNDFTGVSVNSLPLPPANVTATAGVGSVALTWSASAGAVAYRVYRGTSPGGESATPLASVGGTGYTDSAATGGTTWYYFVTAVNGNAAPLPSESDGSAEVSATAATETPAPSTPATPAAPAAPAVPAAPAAPAVDDHLLPDGSAASADQRFVLALYQQFLQRAMSLGEQQAGALDSWVRQLRTAGRIAVVAAIERSGEARAVEVNALYHQYLHRDADAGGLQSFVGQLQRGATIEQVAATLLGSAEYVGMHGGSGGALAALYRDVLGREIDPVGQAVFAGVSPAARASALLSSGEYRTDLIAGVYRRFLGRDADGGSATWVRQLATLATEDVIAALLGDASGEYYARVTG